MLLHFFAGYPNQSTPLLGLDSLVCHIPISRYPRIWIALSSVGVKDAIVMSPAQAYCIRLKCPWYQWTIVVLFIMITRSQRTCSVRDTNVAVSIHAPATQVVHCYVAIQQNQIIPGLYLVSHHSVTDAQSVINSVSMPRYRIMWIGFGRWSIAMATVSCISVIMATSRWYGWVYNVDDNALGVARDLTL